MSKEFKKGQYVEVTSKRGRIEGKISSIDMNPLTGKLEYSVDYLKEGKTWTMICIPSSAIRVTQCKLA